MQGNCFHRAVVISSAFVATKAVGGAPMIEISDETMRSTLATVRSYGLLLLKKGPNYLPPDARPPEQKAIIWEHGRRNMALRAEGKMPLVGPVGRGGDVVGMCVFDVPEAEIHTLMKGDPALIAGLFTYEVLDWFAFPGDSLAPEKA
jgi:predicted small lipoprotein YifL